MISVKHRGDFSNLTSFFQRAKKIVRASDLDKYGRQGVAALASATPVESGETADSWYYEATITKTGATLTFCNSNQVDGAPIAILLQYGHATKNGGWVEGRDYINPAIQPIFDKLANDAWKEVTK